MLHSYHSGLAWSLEGVGHLHQRACVTLLGFLERGWPKSATVQLSATHNTNSFSQTLDGRTSFLLNGWMESPHNPQMSNIGYVVRTTWWTSVRLAIDIVSPRFSLIHLFICSIIQSIV
jgi:hypothetical protein